MPMRHGQTVRDTKDSPIPFSHRDYLPIPYGHLVVYLVASPLNGEKWGDLGRFLPISPQTLKGRCGQFDALGSFLIGSIDRAARENAGLLSASAPPTCLAFSRNLSDGMSSQLLTKTGAMPPHFAGPRGERAVGIWLCYGAPPRDAAWT